MAAHNWEKYFDVNSEYWNKLQKLYEINDNYPKTKVRGRELHHKFLRCFSRVEGAPIDNDKENLVSLSCGDHFLAHYYIWKCTNKGYRRYTCRPVMLMYKKSCKYITDETAERIAADWSDVLKCNGENNKGRKPWNKGIPCSEETRKKMSDAQKDKPKSEEHKRKLSEAGKGHTVSAETRRKLVEAHKGKEPWNKDKKCPQLSNGMKGKHHSEEAKQKIREAHKGENNPMHGRPSPVKGKHWKPGEDGKRVYY